MKKKIIFLLILLVPCNVMAYELTCSRNNIQYGDYFTCDLEDSSSPKHYDSISGEITIPESISCNYQTFNSGLTFNKDNLKFDAAGTITSKKNINS